MRVAQPCQSFELNLPQTGRNRNYFLLTETIHAEPRCGASGPMSSSGMPQIRPGSFIMNLPNRGTNHAVPVSHLLRVDLFGHGRYEVPTLLGGRRVHVVHPH